MVNNASNSHGRMGHEKAELAIQQQQQDEKYSTKTAYFYREGDQRFAPSRVVINRKKYAHLNQLMEDLSDKMRLPRGVRAIFTPRGQHQIRSLDQIVNEGSYVCSSSGEGTKGVDVHNMMVEARPFIAAKPQYDYVREDSRYIRAGVLADEPSDEESQKDVKKRIQKKEEQRQLDRLKIEEKMRGKDQKWAERVRRIIVLRNGEPDKMKHYMLTTSTASNTLKVKADLSAMFGLPVERIYTVDGRLVYDVEDMFRDESSAFIASFGDHFKPMTGYAKYANLQERDLARMANGEKVGSKLPAVRKSDGSTSLNGGPAENGGQPEKLRRYDTVVLPPMERSFTLPKAPTFLNSDEKSRSRRQLSDSLPPLPSKKDGSKRSRGAPGFQRSPTHIPYLTPAHELPPPRRLRSKTMILAGRDQSRKVQFDDTLTQTENNAGNGLPTHSRRSRLGQHLGSLGEPLPTIKPSMTTKSDDNFGSLKKSDRKKSTSDAYLNDLKTKRLQRTRTEILADVQAFSKKANNALKSDNKARPAPVAKPKINQQQQASGFVRLRKKDQLLEKNNQVWEVRVTTGDLPAGVSTSSIILTVYGGRGKSQPIPFTPAKKVFMPRSVEHFTAKIQNVGDVYKIRIESTYAGPNPDWRCDTVIMENGHTGERLEFPCKRWLSETRDDKQTVREIPALSESRPPIPLMSYDVIVHTGNLWNAATLGSVFLEVHGDRGDTGRRNLKFSNHGAPFAKGQVDIFPLECVSLGEVRYIRLKHEPGANSVGWFVENVVLRVRELEMGSQFIFPISRWLNLQEDDGMLEIEVRPVDLVAYMRMQDAHMWPFLRWAFTLPEAELMFYSCNSRKPLRLTASGFIDARSEAVDVTDGNAVFNVVSADGLAHENTVALRSTSSRAPAYIAFSQRKVVAKADYSAACDLRIHVLPSRAVNLESEKFPNNYVSILSSGQLHPETENPMPGPAQAFFCYVRGAFRDGGIIALNTSKLQTLCVEKDPSVLTALGKRNKLAHFRVHKVSSGSVRKFESVVFSGCYLQIRKGVCNAAGNGDRYCEFKVRRNREQNFVSLESLRERGCFIGFTNTGSVYPLIDATSNHPNTILYPEIVELGRRKMPQVLNAGPKGKAVGARKTDYGIGGTTSRLHIEQPLHKRPQMWSSTNRRSRNKANLDLSDDEDDKAPVQRPRKPKSPYRSQVRRAPIKPSVGLKKKAKKENGETAEPKSNRFEELSKPPPRITNANKPSSPKKSVRRSNAPPPRVATLPVKQRGPAQKPDPHQFKDEDVEERIIEAEKPKRKPAPRPPPRVAETKTKPKPKQVDDDNESAEEKETEKKPKDDVSKKKPPPRPPVVKPTREAKPEPPKDDNADRKAEPVPKAAPQPRKQPPKPAPKPINEGKKAEPKPKPNNAGAKAAPAKKAPPAKSGAAAKTGAPANTGAAAKKSDGKQGQAGSKKGVSFGDKSNAKGGAKKKAEKVEAKPEPEPPANAEAEKEKKKGCVIS